MAMEEWKCGQKGEWLHRMPSVMGNWPGHSHYYHRTKTGLISFSKLDQAKEFISRFDRRITIPKYLLKSGKPLEETLPHDEFDYIYDENDEFDYIKGKFKNVKQTYYNTKKLIIIKFSANKVLDAEGVEIVGGSRHKLRIYDYNNNMWEPTNEYWQPRDRG